MTRHSSIMKLWQNRIPSPSDFPFGSKSDPPFAPPIGSPVREFLKICSNPRNLMIPRYTEGWNRNPPLYGPSALLNWTRKPRLIWTSPRSSCQGTRKISCRSGSQMRSMTFASPIENLLHSLVELGLPRVSLDHVLVHRLKPLRQSHTLPPRNECEVAACPAARFSRMYLPCRSRQARLAETGGIGDTTG